MQYVVVASRRDVLDMYHRVGEWLSGYCVSDVALHPDVGLTRMEWTK
jgi:hypothetical protein